MYWDMLVQPEFRIVILLSQISTCTAIQRYPPRCLCITEKENNHIYTNGNNAKALNKVPFLIDMDSSISSLDTIWNGFMNYLDE